MQMQNIAENIKICNLNKTIKTFTKKDQNPIYANKK